MLSILIIFQVHADVPFHGDLNLAVAHDDHAVLSLEILAGTGVVEYALSAALPKQLRAKAHLPIGFTVTCNVA